MAYSLSSLFKGRCEPTLYSVSGSGHPDYTSHLGYFLSESSGYFTEYFGVT